MDNAESIKYLFDKKISFREKEIIETNHFKEELYNVYNKDLWFVIELLQDGNPTKESKDKIKVEKITREGRWELVYAETENEIILIHIKLCK